MRIVALLIALCFAFPSAEARTQKVQPVKASKPKVKKNKNAPKGRKAPKAAKRKRSAL